MKKILYLFCVLGVTLACSKQESTNLTNNVPQARNSSADVVYYYKGKTYPLHFLEGNTGNFVEDENLEALELATKGKPLTSFEFSYHPSNHHFLFDSEFEAYDYVEKNGYPLIGRKFKLAHRIDELRILLLNKYGERLDFNNPNIYTEALQHIKGIYTELKIANDLPKRIEDFIGKKEAHKNQRSGPLMQVFVHDNMQGNMLDIETAPNTVTWTHGAWGCYRTTANPDLSKEFQANGNNWDGCISSFCVNYVDGADGVCYALYKDTHYAQYACSRHKMVIREGQGIQEACIPSLTNRVWMPLCGHMNDQISSIRIKVAWQGCPLDWSDL
ncbi:hypothetical protein [Aureispira sp. CCB-QB1]|uniref:hypothetical protein n=1 Tax=Aureispira sp. CCB-QB1 TaxID=1313421 RepID=UPI000697AA4A|nr:hypothetical protein [Aureispira sp. CCB-QB1]